jgi:hypothetical protein
MAYGMCFEFMCQRMAIQHPSDENDFGKSWGQIEKEFIKQLNRLLHAKGVILISHSVVSEIKSRTGETFQFMEPSMPKQAGRFLTGVVDLYAYYGYYGSERKLLIQGDEFIGAGNRLQEYGLMFHTTKGEKVVSIPMGKNSTEGYKNLMSAFSNKQVETGSEMLAPAKKNKELELAKAVNQPKISKVKK